MLEAYTRQRVYSDKRENRKLVHYTSVTFYDH